MSSYIIDKALTVQKSGSPTIRLDDTASLVKWDISTDGSDNMLIGTGTDPDILKFLPTGRVQSSGFRFADNVDNTKQMEFDLSSITAGVTRVLSVPDADITLIGTDSIQAFTNKTLTSNTNNIKSGFGNISYSLTVICKYAP